MKKSNSNVILILLFVCVSAGVFLMQFLLFHKPGDTVFYFLQDMAFLPVQVAIVTIVLGKMISNREKRQKMKKTNMAISAFFSEAGTAMITGLLKFYRNPEEIRAELNISGQWTDSDFKNAVKLAKNNKFDIGCTVENLREIKTILTEKRDFMLIMLENPNLLEHDTFSDMLWAVFHLTDELIARENIENLPEPDINHLASDAKRALDNILVQWINHMKHLKSDYPYLFSLEVRRSPFNEKNGVVIE